MHMWQKQQEWQKQQGGGLASGLPSDTREIQTNLIEFHTNWVIQKMDDEGNTYFDAKCKCGQCSDCDWHFEYRQTKIYLRTCLKEVTRKRKGQGE